MTLQAQDIPAFDIATQTCIYRLSGLRQLRGLSDGVDKIKVDVRWSSRLAVEEKWFELAYSVACQDSEFVISPMVPKSGHSSSAVGGRAIGNVTEEEMASTERRLGLENLLFHVKPLIADHVILARLELWRAASVAEDELTEDHTSSDGGILPIPRF